jgi:hypothetical protein
LTRQKIQSRVQTLVARLIFCQAGGVRKSSLLFLIVFALSGRGAEIKIDFGDFPAGQTPDHFHGALAGDGKPGDWKIVMDSGGLEQMAGVVFRFQNESNFYAICADALENNFQCYKVENGLRKPPLGQEMTISKGDWHEMAVQCEGNRIVCSLDGKDVIKLVDSTYSGDPNKIGFETKADSVAYFGVTKIDYTPRIPAAQTLVQSMMQKYPRILGLRIYAPDDKGQPRVIASKDEKEIGQPGTDAEKSAGTDGKIFFGRVSGTIVLTLPFRDRNGDPVAAVRVQLKSFPGETQDTALTRAMIIVKDMQAQISSGEELTQ